MLRPPPCGTGCHRLGSLRPAQTHATKQSTFSAAAEVIYCFQLLSHSPASLSLSPLSPCMPVNTNSTKSRHLSSKVHLDDPIVSTEKDIPSVDTHTRPVSVGRTNRGQRQNCGLHEYNEDQGRGMQLRLGVRECLAVLLTDTRHGGARPTPTSLQRVISFTFLDTNAFVERFAPLRNAVNHG